MEEEIDYFKDEYELEAENRIRNLCWTVSGDYNMSITPDLESFKLSKYIGLYDAIKQGAFAKYLDKEALSTYIVKKVFLSGDKDYLMYIMQMCVDSAIKDALCQDRPGVLAIRKQAYEDILEYKFDKMTATFLGRIKIEVLKQELGFSNGASQNIDEYVKLIQSLENVTDSRKIIEAVDYIYNSCIDNTFEKKHGDLEKVLSVTMEELSEYDWKDFLNDEMYEDMLERYMEDIESELSDIANTPEEKKEKEEERKNNSSIRAYTEEDVEKIYSYVELNYGRSYLNENEQKRLNNRICRGMHTNCRLYFTEGILANPVKVNYQYKYAQRMISNNQFELNNNFRVVKKNISHLASTLKHSLIFRNQREFELSDNGLIVPSRLWRLGRVRDDRIFSKEIRKDNSRFVVDILIDSSGSQRKQAPKVAIQAYIISAALSQAKIAHRVMGFSTFWNYTIMQRFREYDDPESKDKEILKFLVSSNNRDGLAIRAATDSLIQREEDNKILIILSDGKPNDVAIKRSGAAKAKPYIGKAAINDTALEIRKCRSLGISVLGVFTGHEEDLIAEKKIFGKDFAYIRDINNFSNIVSVYLKKQITDT
ncbi:Cobalamin biosynthesis protein CobT VWA domain-containing protein [Acetitomaculum ruminis DSM 5522]|uniref:Cobalamin biosynthesis protein CobT VWA domain-containing protein n=1 Tax=Acetitomaculum ruminis DSM 5522 TaxID=1120918 RepID=A0A1I0Z406_9FIRM|nr:nitric oxide reductase activation protein [Acetitomaculum ruminis]SFB20355.1 Cobalamin biosynthesis protein CobT VWA domain-containing protein [Acetitomaculum ruminis DSM 5522]